MGSDAEQARRPGLLVLGGHETWTEAVRLAATELGVTHVELVVSARDAMRALSSNDHAFSHLLVPPGLAGDVLSELIGLTSGESGSGVALVVLGETAAGALAAARHLQVTFVSDASDGWLERALVRQPTAAAEEKAIPEPELREALSDARILPRYQPIVRMSDRRPIGLEVLARLNHPARGTVPPHLFVPGSEAAGLGAELTEAVMQRALMDWPSAALTALGLTLSMNVPLDVFVRADAMARLDRLREAAGVAAEHVVFELTESQPLSRLPVVLAAARALRAKGYGLAIDDVSPDVRDHHALLDMPFTILKLDRQLVREAPDDDQAQAFLLRAVSAARLRGLSITAEGVEDRDIWNRMAALGVDCAQGFMVARPLPAAVVPVWHKDWCSR